MLITIDTSDATAPAAGTRFTTAVEPATVASDAGGGPPDDAAQAEPQAAPAGFDAGGPPSWLTAAVAAAESATLARFGFAPTPAAAGESPSSNVDDAGSGPADDPVQ